MLNVLAEIRMQHCRALSHIQNLNSNFTAIKESFIVDVKCIIGVFNHHLSSLTACLVF